ncbi:t-SNARE [Phlebopus sp. FC_14]|nr:t-SNARE [Phlebopus sp. FC_14]
MSIDPYHAVQQEIQSSLQAASTLRASYLRIRSTAREGSEELVWARNELKATLAALEADLEDLEESVKVVESTGPRLFNLDDSEVMERKKYVGRVRREIEDTKAEVEGTKTPRPQSPYPYASPAGGGSRSPLPSMNHMSPREDEDEQRQWAREEQRLMIQEQDRTMDSISGTLTTLAQQAGLMGQEIGQHVEMLDDLERNVDHTDTRLSSAMRKMRRFIRDTEETKSGWCITILVVILIILLVVVIMV